MPDLTGQTLGKYQLIERMGRGGMADVYKGFQPGLERLVAVKVLHPHLAEQDDFIVRFKREAQAVAGLKHPHIIQIFDFDVQEDAYYMVMDYIEGGRTLKELLQEFNESGESLGVKQAMDITAKIADALDYAHQQNMVHRDIKPSNVLVPTTDDPVLADFGIARLLDQSGLTASGAMIGTPAYMSPEQGRGETADERSDIYALGIVLYELVTGQPPYDADTPYGVILKHINEPLISPRQIVEDMPEIVEQIVFKCLAKDPADRYGSAGDMRDAIRNALTFMAEATQPGQATRPLQRPEAEVTIAAVTPPEETRISEGSESLDLPVEKRPARKWLLIGGIIGALAIVGVILFFVFFNTTPTGRLEVSADETFYAGDYTGAVADYEEAYELSDELYYLEQAASIAVYAEDYGTALEHYEQIVSESLSEPRYLVGQAYAHYRTGDTEEAYNIALRADSLEPDRLDVRYLLGLIARETKQFDEALEHFNAVVEADVELWDYADPYFYIQYGHETHYDMALTTYEIGDLERTHDLLDQSMDFDDWWIEPHLLRAELYQLQDNPSMAREELLFALDVAESDYPEQVEMIQEMLNELGN